MHDAASSRSIYWLLGISGVMASLIVVAGLVWKHEAQLNSEERAAQVAQENALALEAQKNYEVIKAPFAGTIAAPYADPGALLQAATGAHTTALPVVTLSQKNRLRVYVYPDQRTASLVAVGDRVEIADATRPEVRGSATASRTSGELTPKLERFSLRATWITVKEKSWQAAWSRSPCFFVPPRLPRFRPDA